jgi:ankyrin repeat protein
MTPLLWALKSKNKQIYEFILKRGGDPNIKIKKGRLKNKSVMFLVCLMDDSSYLETTLNYTKRVNNSTINCNALSNTISISKNSLAKVKMLVAAGVKINQKNSMGDPPIVTAGIINQWHIVYYLLQAGADPMLTSNDGMSLIYLIEKSNELMSRKGFRYQYLLRCAKLLKDKGIKVDVSKPQKYPEPDL